MEVLEWIESYSLAVDEYFCLAIEAGAYAGLLAAVVLAINVLLRRWLTAGQMALMWGLVLLRLLVPVAPSSPFSIEGVCFNSEAGTTHEIAATSSDDVPLKPDATPLANLEMPGSRAATPAGDAIEWVDAMLTAVPALWAIGGVLGFGITVINYVRFRRRVNRVDDCDDVRLARLWVECCGLAGVRRPGRIVQFDGVEQPAIMGLFRRTLLLPASVAELDDPQIRMVMLHELAHVRRWDLVANWALILIRAFHWWNPVYWLAASRYRSLREQACDAFVVRRLEGGDTRNYGELLLQLSGRRPGRATWRVMVPASLLSFFPSVFRQRAVRTRLKALRRAGVAWGRWQAATVAVLVSMLVVGGFTAAREVPEEPVDLSTWMAQHPEAVLERQRPYEVKEVYSGPCVTREYDLSESIERIAVEAASDAAARLELESTLKLLFFQSSAAKNTEGTLHRVYQRDAQNSATDAESIDAPTYSIEGTTLSVRAPVALHERLQRTLDAWSESGLAQIVVETRFVSTNRDLVADLGASWQFLEALSSDHGNTMPPVGRDGEPVVRAESRVEEYFPLVVSTLSAEQTAKLLKIAQGDARTNVLNAPKITIFNGQEATIADCAQRPFVIGAIPVVGELQSALQPKIVVLEEGTRIKARAVQSRDGESAHLEASLDMRAVGEVTTATTTYCGSVISIQVPRVNRRSIDVAAKLQRGETLLVGCLPTDKQQGFFYGLLSATPLGKPAENP